MTKPRRNGAPTTPTSAAADAVAEDTIGENLRRLFGAVEQEELPDRFKDLLRKLAEEGDGR